MSNIPNKRSHEDGGNGSGSGNHGHSSGLKYPHNDPSGYPKITPVVHDYHSSYDPGQDSRIPKTQRTESRDADRRSPLLPTYRMSSSSSDPHSDHPAALESRVDVREQKDNTKDPKVENRETKAEAKELFQGAKVEKDLKLGSWSDDNKETKNGWDASAENKGDIKTDKDSFGGPGSMNLEDKKGTYWERYPDASAEKTEPWQTVGTKEEKDGFGWSSSVSWKDPKDHWGKSRLDASGDNVDPWQSYGTNVRRTLELRMEEPNASSQCAEIHEAVGENKIDFKREDKFKDKDRKRKEGKSWEWGEREKERNDRRSNLPQGNNNCENKDLLREDRETEKRERERKDLSKDKERPKDKEKDYMKRDAWNGSERGSSQNEKELVDPNRAVEQENPISEQKKQKEHDSWKNVDRDSRERKKERDVDAEGERPEKRSRYHDKESEDGGVDTEAGGEREREVFSSGIQQRKRMLRPRSSPQVSNREPRFRSRSHDNEGSQGKSDMSTVVYRVGECMQELIKLWKEYESSQADKTCDSFQNGPSLEIRIPAEHVTATNRQVRGGQLWGTDIYTVDSDLVAVLMHTGYCRPTASPPPPATQELRATIRVLPPQDCYISTLRNNVRSRAWGAAIGCSYRVERCCIVKKGGGTIDLEPCLTHTSTLEPTLAPVAVERTMTTRAAASNALRQQRFVREVTIQFNLCNEPWLKYSISVVADKGLKKPLFTSSRLKKGEVLYLETHSCRYELCFNGEKMVKSATAPHGHEVEPQTHNSHPPNGDRTSGDGESVLIDVFRWSRCKKPLPQKLMRSIGIPLPLEHVEVLEENLEWEEIQWSQTGVWIAGKEYHLARAHFLTPV